MNRALVAAGVPPGGPFPGSRAVGRSKRNQAIPLNGAHPFARLSHAVLLLLLLIRFLTPAQADEPAPFRTGILPILTKAGCNSGGCHGAATGQGGFKLSLFGYDPDEDYLRITRERAGRRVDFDRPEDSLFLRKPARQLDHEGGRRLPADSVDYQVVLAWIAAEAPRGPADLHVTSIDVTPGDILLPDPSETVPLRVSARLSDGSEQDVTRLALYTSNDEAVAEVSRVGAVTSRGRGLTSIMVRYAGQVAAARIAIPYGPARTTADFPELNFIDTHIRTELERLGLDPSSRSADPDFLRRLTLDLLGRLPTPDEARAWALEPGTTERRAALIGTLIDRPEFNDYWTLQFADLLLLGGKGPVEQGPRQYHAWLRDQIARNAPLDQLVRDLLTAEGDIRTVGPANFFTLSNDPRDLSEHVGRMFLGSRIACARCHAHPSDRWTQDDYHQFAAYFARVGRDGDRVQVRQRGEVDHPKSGLPVAPKPLGAPRPSARPTDSRSDAPQTGTKARDAGSASGEPGRDGWIPAESTAAESDRRIELAAWLTAPENPLFARSLVNRLWKHFFGRGLVEPVDDLRPTNPATHPALLDALARDFVGHRFDLRHLIRTITASHTYQLASTSTPSNRLDDRLYSRAYLRELPAPVFLDAVVQATGVPHTFDGQPDGIRAVQLVSPQIASASLDVLGRCDRSGPCSSSAPGGGLARALHLVNGSTLHDKLNDGIVAQLDDSNVPDPHVVSELYLRTLTRSPSDDERAVWESHLGGATHRREAIQDLLWTLLNSREFGFNH